MELKEWPVGVVPDVDGEYVARLLGGIGFWNFPEERSIAEKGQYKDHRQFYGPIPADTPTEFSSSLPSEPGWYWWRYGGGYHLVIYRVDWFGKGLALWQYGQSLPLPVDDGGEWLKIEEPKGRNHAENLCEQ